MWLGFPLQGRGYQVFFRLVVDDNGEEKRSRWSTNDWLKTLNSTYFLGDVILGGLFPVHEKSETENEVQKKLTNTFQHFVLKSSDFTSDSLGLLNYGPINHNSPRILFGSFWSCLVLLINDQKNMFRNGVGINDSKEGMQYCPKNSVLILFEIPCGFPWYYIWPSMCL